MILYGIAAGGFVCLVILAYLVYLLESRYEVPE